MYQKLTPQEYLSRYSPHRAPDGQWHVWEHTANTPHIVASFADWQQAMDHAIRLNALSREESCATHSTTDPVRHRPRGMIDAVFRFLRSRSSLLANRRRRR